MRKKLTVVDLNNLVTNAKRMKRERIINLILESRTKIAERIPVDTVCRVVDEIIEIIKQDKS
jgi:hypothetical protein